MSVDSDRSRQESPSEGTTSLTPSLATDGRTELLGLGAQLASVLCAVLAAFWSGKHPLGTWFGGHNLRTLLWLFAIWSSFWLLCAASLCWLGRTRPSLRARVRSVRRGSGVVLLLLYGVLGVMQLWFVVVTSAAQPGEFRQTGLFLLCSVGAILLGAGAESSALALGRIRP